ncbi:bis(5'-nucleosyl)-tetraphosphatase (symmetrical) YqeK [Marinitoga sp. 1138]|uniref:bis(5'-nucleosyl)-tetraphosphatase (symmetrical) YqeK n=1 Tax=Marinitoga sp. 1138 TaxID=1643334 RepID=UPI00158658D8|nr:bis(5'-nucleosyl)-tetraphosphatase (symmetrical) YqeK [Marinitoga sp. 1138]NUU97106.1 hypothetical protein [Marinitoga sp. 1138]
METIKEEIKELLNKLVSPYRLKHIMGVAYMSKILANLYGVSELKAEIAAFGHDLFRDVKPYRFLNMAKSYGLELSKAEVKNPILLHGKIAAEFLKKKYNICNDIYEAIYFHTSGCKCFNTNIIGKILFISDSIEPTRNYENVEYLRELAKRDIEKAYIEILKNKIIYAIEKKHLLLYETVEAWNYNIMEVE